MRVEIAGCVEAACEIDAWRTDGARIAGRIGGSGADLEATERVDQVGEARPAEAVLLAVLETTDDGLVDPGIRLELALGPAQPKSAPSERSAEEIEAVLTLGISVSLFEPRHPSTLVESAYRSLIGRLPAADAVYRHQE